MIFLYGAYLEYIALHFALADKPCRSARHILAEKNVTYNIALESTTYVKINVTLDVTLQHGNITFVRFA